MLNFSVTSYMPWWWFGQPKPLDLVDVRQQQVEVAGKFAAEIQTVDVDAIKEVLPGSGGMIDGIPEWDFMGF